MQFALLIYHSPEESAMRNNEYDDPHLGAWRAYYKALVEAASTSPAIHSKCPRPERQCVSVKESGACRTDPTPTRRSN